MRWPRVTAEGETPARELWSRLDPRPIAGFGAFRERLSQCLAAGYTADALRRVAGHVDVWSRAGIEMAFARRGVNPKTSRPPSPRPPNHPPPASQEPLDPPPISEVLGAWEALSEEIRERAAERVRRRHPTATTWGDGVLWRALVVAAATGEHERVAEIPGR